MLGFNVVREYQRLVVFRGGNLARVAGSGLAFVVPLLESVIWVDLREARLPIPRVTCVTADGVSIEVDLLVFISVMYANLALTEVAGYAQATQEVASSALRAAVGLVALNQVLEQRQEMSQAIKTALEAVADRWGIRVVLAEISDILLPNRIQDALNRRIVAEQEQLAITAEVENERQVKIAAAETEKEALILKAEGELRVRQAAAPPDEVARLRQELKLAQEMIAELHHERDSLEEQLRTTQQALRESSLERAQLLKLLGNGNR